MIGFEPVEKIENGIRLRFRGLSKTKLNGTLNPLNCFQPCVDQDGYTKIAHFSPYRPVLDGTIIDIVAQDDSAIPSWVLFLLRRDLIWMAFLCGAAEDNDDDDLESKDDDKEASQAKVARWIAETASTVLQTGLGQSLLSQTLPKFL